MAPVLEKNPFNGTRFENKQDYDIRLMAELKAHASFEEPSPRAGIAMESPERPTFRRIKSDGSANGETKRKVQQLKELSESFNDIIKQWPESPMPLQKRNSVHSAALTEMSKRLQHKESHHELPVALDPKLERTDSLLDPIAITLAAPAEGPGAPKSSKPWADGLSKFASKVRIVTHTSPSNKLKDIMLKTEPDVMNTPPPASSGSMLKKGTNAMSKWLHRGESDKDSPIQETSKSEGFEEDIPVRSRSRSIPNRIGAVLDPKPKSGAFLSSILPKRAPSAGIPLARSNSTNKTIEKAAEILKSEADPPARRGIRKSHSLILDVDNTEQNKPKSGGIMGVIKRIGSATPPLSLSPSNCGDESMEEVERPSTTQRIRNFAKKTRSMSQDFIPDSNEFQSVGTKWGNIGTEAADSWKKIFSRTRRAKKRLTPHFDPKAFHPDALSFSDCIQDPMLTRIFLENLALKDSFKLMFIFSVDEFCTLVESDTPSPLPIQVTYAKNIIKKYMTEESSFEIIGTIDREAGENLSNILSEISKSNAENVPEDLFKTYYDTILDDLSRTFCKFRETPSYGEMVMKHEKRKKMLSLEQVLEDEWICLVFWAHLFNDGGHHHSVGLWIELHFGAQPLIDNLVDQPAVRRKFLRFVQRLMQKYLNENAPLAFASAISNGNDVKQNICQDMQPFLDDPERNATLEECVTLVTKLSDLKQKTLQDLKRLHHERLKFFLSNSIYQAYVVDRDHELTPGQLVVKLLRDCNVPMYRAPSTFHNKYTLSALMVSKDNSAICNVFSYQFSKDGTSTNLDVEHHFQGDNSAQESLFHQIEPFLCPEFDENVPFVCKTSQDPKLFNILIGTGENMYYGVIYRAFKLEGDSDYLPRGFGMLSRYPLLEHIRDKAAALCPAAHLSSKQLLRTDILSDLLRESPVLHQPEMNSDVMLSPIDIRMDDIFDTLSIDNILRLFALVLHERRIILKAGNFTTLMNVSEALKAFIFPLTWCHVYMPVLPTCMKEYLHCPTPFIFGVHSSCNEIGLPPPSDDLVIVDLTTNSIMGGGSESVLPSAIHDKMHSELFSILKPRIQQRDQVPVRNRGNSKSFVEPPFPVGRIRGVFANTMFDILRNLELESSRFLVDETQLLAIDALTHQMGNETPSEASRFMQMLLENQSLSNYLGQLDTIPVLLAFET